MSRETGLDQGLLEVTEIGTARVGLVYTPLPGRGSSIHRFWQERIRVWQRALHPSVQVEQADGAIWWDVWVKRVDGVIEVFEVVLDLSTLERAVEKIVASDQQATIVVPDIPSARRAQRLLDASGLQLRSAVSVRTLAEVVAASRCE